ncbi:ribonuclease H-like domain-containing protein [Halorussus halobius]|uniref:ribonuclease H-like domain-containing protein n=1 Tax=Halorussus halobius TaxID=1710537 RepID=UPI001091BFC1|nr:ribonuclease H-like domain-containing protein [Halorussus halobius]
MVLEQVAFDIETTGFNVDDEVTTVGFAVPMGVRVFVQTGERDAPGIESAVESEVSETLVRVSAHASESELLAAVSEFVAERIRDDMLLVAYNGERWNGGFDVPFLRTRYAQRDLAWPFVDVPYADVMPLVTDRFNTTVDGTEQGDLVTAYDVLCDGSYGDLDPFDDSAEAVAAFEDGRFAELVLHNVADVLRTRALGRVAERYCSKSEFKVKSLTPTRSI